LEGGGPGKKNIVNMDRNRRVLQAMHDGLRGMTWTKKELFRSVCGGEGEERLGSKRRKTGKMAVEFNDQKMHKTTGRRPRKGREVRRRWLETY